MVCALPIVIAAKMPILQYRFTVVTIVVKNMQGDYLAQNLVYNYCVGLKTVVTK
jgi:hypothetical protein